MLALQRVGGLAQTDTLGVNEDDRKLEIYAVFPAATPVQMRDLYFSPDEMVLALRAHFFR